MRCAIWGLGKMKTNAKGKGWRGDLDLILSLAKAKVLLLLVYKVTVLLLLAIYLSIHLVPALIGKAYAWFLIGSCSAIENNKDAFE